MIRIHRDNATHRRIIAAYRAERRLCEPCLYDGHIRSAKEIHHIQPVAEGGPTTPENLIACCTDCHLLLAKLHPLHQKKFKIDPVTA